MILTLQLTVMLYCWCRKEKCMFKIGDLSKITDVSVKTIRFYEEQGLIQPIEVDRWTGYRYYDESSIVKLSEIIYLKQLGFSLKDIASFDENKIQDKIKELHEKITQLNKNIDTLSTIKKEGEKYIMKTFINDPQVIGKWKKVAVVKNKKEFELNNFDDEKIFNYDELYFLPNGEKYWVFSWTKGTLYLNERCLPYEIIDDKLYIGVVDFKTNKIDNYAVYEQVDNKVYKKEEIKIKDNTNIPFITDDKVVGFWESVDYVRNIEDYKPGKKFWSENLTLKSYTFNPNGGLLIEFNGDKNIRKVNWSKGVVINEKSSKVSEYIIKEIENETIMFVEWKSGDYTYGGQVRGYFVLKKTK